MQSVYSVDWWSRKCPFLTQNGQFLNLHFRPFENRRVGDFRKCNTVPAKIGLWPILAEKISKFFQKLEKFFKKIKFFKKVKNSPSLNEERALKKGPQNPYHQHPFFRKTPFFEKIEISKIFRNFWPEARAEGHLSPSNTTIPIFENKFQKTQTANVKTFGQSRSRLECPVTCTRPNNPLITRKVISPIILFSNSRIRALNGVRDRSPVKARPERRDLVAKMLQKDSDPTIKGPIWPALLKFWLRPKSSKIRSKSNFCRSWIELLNSHPAAPKRGSELAELARFCQKSRSSNFDFWPPKILGIATTIWKSPSATSENSSLGPGIWPWARILKVDWRSKSTFETPCRKDRKMSILKLKIGRIHTSKPHFSIFGPKMA